MKVTPETITTKHMHEICENEEAVKMADRLMKTNALDFIEVSVLVYNAYIA